MLRRILPLALLTTLLLAGCAVPSPPASSPSAGSGASADAAVHDPVALPWQRDACDDPARAPAGNVPPWAAARWSTRDLLRKVAAHVGVEVAEFLEGDGFVNGHTPGTSLVAYRSGNPWLELRMDRAWPSLRMAEARPALDALLATLELPPLGPATPYAEQEGRLHGEFALPGERPGLLVLEATPSLTRITIIPQRGVPGDWQVAGAQPDDAVQAAGLAFVECLVRANRVPWDGETRFGWASDYPAITHGSVGRSMNVYHPVAGHHCGGPDHTVVVDVVTLAVLDHRAGQPCI